MRNKLFSPPPDYIISGGKKYNINTDFRVWVDICNVMADEKISAKDKLCFLLINGYCDTLPDNMGEAVSALIGFMNKYERKNHEKKDRTPVFSFLKDEALIYAAFFQQYGFNLYTEQLHWWEFLALLSALDDNTAFMRIVGYRSVDCAKIKDENTRRFYRKMKNRYRLCDKVDDEEIASVLG